MEAWRDGLNRMRHTTQFIGHQNIDLKKVNWPGVLKVPAS